MLRMSESNESESNIDYGRDYPRHHNLSRDVDPHTNDIDVDLGAVNSLINQRVAARESKDFRTADNILNQLLTQHSVIINDTNNTWKSLTKREVKKRKKVEKLKPKVAFDHNGPNNNGSSSSNHNHAYQESPDAGVNTSTFSEEEILALLDDRRHAQRTRDYEQADDIRHQLKLAGVYVEDGLKEFRADGVPFSTLRGKVRGHASTSPTALVQSSYSLDFVKADDEAIVNGLLEERMRAKSARKFFEADSIRDRLYEAYNIRIDDKLGEWSIGGNFGDSRSEWATTSSEERLRYTKSIASRELSSEDERNIQAKVEERMRAKRTRNYALSDYIRDELYRRYDVTIHDKINEWSAGGDFGEENSWTHVVPVPTLKNVDESKELLIEDDDDVEQEDYQGLQESDDSPSPSPLAREQLEWLTVVQLKEMLRDAGLTVGGTKAKLIDRLLG